MASSISMSAGVRVAILAVVLLSALTGAPIAQAAFPGANGKIGFVVDPSGPGAPQITTIDPDGQNRLELTSGSDQHYDPSFSADGERIVFASAPPATTPGQIWVMNHDGSGQAQLTAGTPNALDLSPEFSPNGRTIVFDRYNGMVTTQVWAMNDDGSGQTQLTTAANSSRTPSFSPDGSKIVFARSGPAGSAIWIMNSDGSDPTPLTTGSSSADDGSPSFSPDGRQIVFDRYNGSQQDIWVMNADGTGQAPVTSTPQLESGASFSPDGSQIAFVRNETGPDRLFTVPAGGGAATPIPGSEDAYGQSQTGWQPLNAPACDVTGAPKQSSFKAIVVTVTCSNENAVAAVSGAGEAKKVSKLVAASKKKRFDIPPVTVQIPAGTQTQVSLPIPKKGRRALKRAAKAGKKGSAIVTASLTDDLGQASQDGFAVKFKKKKKKK